MWFGPTYGNRTARARRPAYRRAKTLLRSVFRAREILRTGHRSLLPQLRLGGYFYASVRGIAAQATAACGGCREPEQGRGPQRASPAQGVLTDAGYPRPVQGVPAGDSRRVSGRSPFAMWFGPTYGNCCAGDRRLRRMQGAGAGPRVAEGKPRPRGADRCGVPAPGTGRRTVCSCKAFSERAVTGHKAPNEFLKIIC